MELSWEKASAQLQPATAGHARLVLNKTVPFFCTTLYRDVLKGGPVLLSNSQVRPGGIFLQPRAHLLVKLCTPCIQTLKDPGCTLWRHRMSQGKLKICWMGCLGPRLHYSISSATSHVPTLLFFVLSHKLSDVWSLVAWPGLDQFHGGRYKPYRV